ncbi:MAG: hypothetical protein H6Q05_1939 [Acidobacteria bacterium]|jgi:hypothetical protein|nr:hypothetical protein [Acidobacteriota bacterium]
MRYHKRIFSIFLVLFLALPAFAQQAGTTVALWRDRGDVPAMDLLDGPGGKNRQPGTNFTFIKETIGGTSPKFEVEDENGSKWKVKLGREAKSETAATRLLWAAGYHADEDYYRPQIHVKGMKPLSRGQEYVSDGGIVREARLERQDGGKKLKNWSWYDNPFVGTREFNGLRVMMALINNWDLKENNNDIYDEGGAEGRYVISDLGASLGRTGSSFARSRGVMKDYEETRFVTKVTPEYVDFVMHSRPFFLTIFYFPYYFHRTRMESVAKHIPIADARWLGNRLGQLSPEQIRDCFRAAGFSPAEVEGYARVVMQRIEALQKL